MLLSMLYANVKILPISKSCQNPAKVLSNSCQNPVNVKRNLIGSLATPVYNFFQCCGGNVGQSFLLPCSVPQAPLAAALCPLTFLPCGPAVSLGLTLPQDIISTLLPPLTCKDCFRIAGLQRHWQESASRDALKSAFQLSHQESHELWS